MTSRTEFEILREAHRFLRGDEGDDGTWEDRLARKYYDGLWKEFAVCDLKHYKSGNFALRWRTESEVLSGTGERSCANARCPLHSPPPDDEERIPGLSTLELPFAYEERGERKSALVKIVLCSRCVRKLMWKREHEKAAASYPSVEPERSSLKDDESQKDSSKHKRRNRSDREQKRDRRTDRPHARSSRSRSPTARKGTKQRRSPSR